MAIVTIMTFSEQMVGTSQNMHMHMQTDTIREMERRDARGKMLRTNGRTTNEARSPVDKGENILGKEESSGFK